ncbi:MAG: site-2 protease family protein, partial [Thermodesulfobacteriota bacterium]
AALRFGDHTAKMTGRLSLNPVRHLDPFGSVLLPGLLIFTGSPIVFGYAKPVPVNFNNLRNPELGTLVVSIAGVAVNLALAVAGGIAFQAVSHLAPQMVQGSALTIVAQALFYFTLINVVLAIFNLIPIPPLDGSKLLSVLLPPQARDVYERITPYGIIILVVFLMSGALGALFTNIIHPITIFLVGR